jgi:hypothetical protein
MKPTRNKRVGEAQSTSTQKHKRKRKVHVSGTLIARIKDFVIFNNYIAIEDSYKTRTNKTMRSPPTQELCYFL